PSCRRRDSRVATPRRASGWGLPPSPPDVSPTLQLVLHILRVLRTLVLVVPSREFDRTPEMIEDDLHALPKCVRAAETVEEDGGAHRPQVRVHNPECGVLLLVGLPMEHPHCEGDAQSEHDRHSIRPAIVPSSFLRRG
ncbi:hypothetical protein PMAYCL1PPCAC_22662, partial [Pristionchus mayeri]